jgi:hypothetical protein
MKNIKVFLTLSVIAITIGVILLFSGRLADKDQYIIADYQEEVIRRADVTEWLMAMPDERRPLIQTQEDYLNALNTMINDRIKADLAKRLKKENKIEVSRDEARKIYFEKHPELMNVYKIVDPTQLDFSAQQLKAMKAEVEFGIDDEMDLLFAEEAHRFYTKESANNGTITVTQEEVDAEYQLQRSDLMTYELVSFDAMVFNQMGQAAATRQRIQNGESFGQLFEQVLNKTPQLAIGRSFENNPNQEQFRRFWLSVSGCKKGDILGPLPLPEHDVLGRTADGRTAAQKFPPSIVVLEVVDRQDPREKTVEEAGIELTVHLLLTKSMDTLRQEYGVVIYKDKLPRPEGYGNQFKDSMIQTEIN